MTKAANQMTSRHRDYPGLSSGPNAIRMVLNKGLQKWEGIPELWHYGANHLFTAALKMEEDHKPRGEDSLEGETA